MRSSNEKASDKVKYVNKIEYFYKYGLYLIFLLLALVFSIATPAFYSVNNLINIVLQSSSMGIAAVGMTFVILTGGVDLSIGSTMYISAITTAFLATIGFDNIILCIIIPVLCGAVIGSINGLVIAKWRVVPFVATLASMTFVRGIGYAICGQTLIYFKGDAQQFLSKTKLFGMIPLIACVFILIVALGYIVLRNTEFGRQIYAVGNNVQVAEKMGIKVSYKLFFAYVFAGMLAGLSGLVSAAQVTSVTPSFGMGLEFIVISSVVLGGVSLFGGKGNVFPGVMTGVLIITCIENGLVLVRADPYLYSIFRGIVIYMAVMMDCLRNKGELR